MKKLLKLDSFWLRIIALIAMTIDHVGVLLDYSDFFWMRMIGRISLPLFIFLAVQGALKTSNKKKYAFRIIALAIFTSICLTVMPFISSVTEDIAYTTGNIFLDILFSILCVWILDSDNRKLRPLVIIPVAYSIFSFVVVRLEGCGCDGLYSWFPPAIRMQYSIFAILLAIGFYYSIKLAEKYQNIDNGIENQQLLANLLSVATVVIVGCLTLALNYIFGAKYTTVIDEIASFSIISGVFILCYNGKKGYNAKWFRILYYIYYPLHISILALICLL